MIDDLTNSKAHQVGRKGRAPKMYPRGRACSYEGCATRLSQYNKRDRCHQHSIRERPRLRGIVIKDDPAALARVTKCRSCVILHNWRVRKGETDSDEEVELDGALHRLDPQQLMTLCEIAAFNG